MFSGIFLGVSFGAWKILQIEMWIFLCGVRFPAYVVLPGTFEITVGDFTHVLFEKHKIRFDPTQILEAFTIFYC